MKLLFDQNLSPRLVQRLADLFPDSSHVFLLGLGEGSDAEIWEYARKNGYVLVSKDADFSELSLLRGFPPKVIWLRIGNCTTTQVEVLLRRHFDTIRHFGPDEDLGILSLL